MAHFDLPDGETFLIRLKALIIKDGKALLLKGTDSVNSNTPWELPGGLIEIHEEPEAALKREAMEETGMTIEVGRPIEVNTGTYEKFIFKNGKVAKVRLIIITFECTLVSGEFKISDEHSEAKFFTPEETKGIKISPYNFPGVKYFQNGLLEPPVSN